MGKLRTIYLAILNKKKRIVEKEEIIGLIEKYKREIKNVNIKNALWYLSRRNYIKRIFLDYYYINSIEEREAGICKYEDKELLFLVLNKLDIKWYVGLNYALYFSGESWQLPNTLSIINNKFSGLKRILSINVRFYKIKEKLIFGLKEAKTNNNIKYKYSLPSKTYIDMVYLRISKKLNKYKKTNNYLRSYPKWVGKR